MRVLVWLPFFCLFFVCYFFRVLVDVCLMHRSYHYTRFCFFVNIIMLIIAFVKHMWFNACRFLFVQAEDGSMFRG
jgi:hypothetical protein